MVAICLGYNIQSLFLKGGTLGQRNNIFVTPQLFFLTETFLVIRYSGIFHFIKPRRTQKRFRGEIYSFIKNMNFFSYMLQYFHQIKKNS